MKEGSGGWKGRSRPAADMIMTQPLFDLRQAKALYEATRNAGVPILPGVMPLVSDGNTEFLHNEVPGFVVPDEVRARMARVGRGTKGPPRGHRHRTGNHRVRPDAFQRPLPYHAIQPFMPMTVELTEFALQATSREKTG